MDMNGDFVSREEFDRLYKDVNGNGQAGVRQNVQQCLEELSAIRGAQDERTRIDSRRWTIQALILTALGLVIGLIGLLEANRQHHAGQLDFPQINHSEQRNWDYAGWRAQQDSDLPPSYQAR